MLNTLKKNAREVFNKIDVLDKMKTTFFLKSSPKKIDCFDISNLGTKYIVGAVVRWHNKQPDYVNFRKYTIKSLENKQDDFKSMREVIFRRYSEIKDKKNLLPDLIIIDGGKGQLNSAKKSLDILNLNIDLISIAKKQEEIFLVGKKNSIQLDKNSEIILLIRKIRDTTHNYVINYNRQKRRVQ